MKREVKILLSVSSVTGNTRRLADYFYEKLKECTVEMIDVRELLKKDKVPEADIYIIAFWCRKASMDFQSRAFLERLQGKRVFAIGTMGAETVGHYGNRVRGNVEALITANNACLGIQLCQGANRPERIEFRRNLPPEDPHHIDEETYRKKMDNQGRPREADMRNAWACAHDRMWDLLEE